MAQVQIKHGHYGKYAGPFITGTRNSPVVNAPPPDASFMMRAFWLLIMAECLARFGIINMRDGTGVTAGLHQAAGCLPKSLRSQGSLFKLLWRLSLCVDLSLTRIGSLLEGQGWAIAPGGVLVDENGKPVTGSQFRDVVTPPNGVTPSQGAEWRTARAWAVAFHELMVDPSTHRAQIVYGVEVLHKQVCRFRAKKYFSATIEELAFGGNAMQPFPFDSIEADLAHALLLSFAINAPAWAFQVYGAELKKLAHRMGDSLDDLIESNREKSTVDPSLRKEIDTEDFGRRLIKALTDKSRKWDDDEKGSRYQRSRDAAMRVWPDALFIDGGVMAEDLPG